MAEPPAGRRARAALHGAATLVERRYRLGGDPGAAVPAMVALNLLRELNLLLGLAIGEAAGAWRIVEPRGRDAAWLRLATLERAGAGEGAALRRLDARRRGLMRRARAASAGTTSDGGPVSYAVLAAAGRLHVALARALDTDRGTAAPMAAPGPALPPHAQEHGAVRRHVEAQP